MRSFAVYLLLCLAASCSHAATWYASSSGTTTNGTEASPWSVAFALTNLSANTFKQPGDTILFLNGVHVCTETNKSGLANGYQQELYGSGTPVAPIRYRSKNPWGFAFDGGIYIGSGTSNIIFERFTIYWTGISNRANLTNAWSTGGITEFGPDNKIQHNIIENTGHAGIASWSTTHGKYICGNVIRYIGWWDYVNYSPGVGSLAGSGMYLQNANGNPEALIQGNISYFNATTGMKAYGNRQITNFTFRWNAVAEQNEAGIFYHTDQEDSHGVNVISNYVWKGGPAGLRIGYQLGNANPSNAVLIGNYIVDTNAPLSFTDDWSYTTVSNNIFINWWRRIVASIGVPPDTGAGTNTWYMGGNKYYGGSYTGFGAESFAILQSQRTFSEWTNNLGGRDVDSTLTLGDPGTTDVRVFRPSTDTSFVHIVVFNWPTNSSTTADISSLVPIGSKLTLYDAQNVPTSFSNLTYNGGSIDLPLALTNRAPMWGTLTNKAESEFLGFDPRFRAFIVYAEPSTSPGLYPAVFSESQRDRLRVR